MLCWTRALKVIVMRGIYLCDQNRNYYSNLLVLWSKHFDNVSQKVHLKFCCNSLSPVFHLTGLALIKT